MTGLTHRKKDSALLQHSLQHHPLRHLEERDFRLQVNGHHHTPLGRQAEEGARLTLELANMDIIPSLDSTNDERKEEEYREKIILNSKNEFHQPLGMTRTFTRYLTED